MSYPNLTTLAAVSPRTDSDLFHLTQGTAPDVADLALALGELVKRCRLNCGGDFQRAPPTSSTGSRTHWVRDWR